MTLGKLYTVGLGPGSLSQLSDRARQVIGESEVIIGYRTYLDQIRELLDGKDVRASGMRQEVERARLAVKLANSHRKVAVVCSGDSGIYGMAGLIFEVLRAEGWPRPGGIEVEVVPGIPALSACASLLGAPLTHDFAVISLSDLLTPWDVIARRLELAARADFVIVFYNPKSKRRTEQLATARQIVLGFRAPRTPVGIVRNAYREGQSVVVTDLDHMLEHEVDMFCTVIIGNSTSFPLDGLMITPRGYSGKYDLSPGA
ncbi:MAG: precorrin-3B C(17)-methyltransferase [Actinobacteria bacterium]|nr:precorrin-3B C(17)-methyltransferase [Actinomycetota bacterium]